MDEKQLIAFRMKYQGKSYEEISKATGYAFSTVLTYFANEGAWKDSYELWANNESKYAQERVRKALDSVLEIAGDILVNALVRANKRVKSLESQLEVEQEPKKKVDIEWNLQKAEERATALAERIMDRAGMSILNRSRIETVKVPEGYDEITQRLIAGGIDPASIGYRSNAPVAKEGLLPN